MAPRSGEGEEMRGSGFWKQAGPQLAYVTGSAHLPAGPLPAGPLSAGWAAPALLRTSAFLPYSLTQQTLLGTRHCPQPSDRDKILAQCHPCSCWPVCLHPRHDGWGPPEGQPHRAPKWLSPAPRSPSRPCFPSLLLALLARVPVTSFLPSPNLSPGSSILVVLSPAVHSAQHPLVLYFPCLLQAWLP